MNHAEDHGDAERLFRRARGGGPAEGLRHPFGARISLETSAGVIERHLPDTSGEPDRFPDRTQIEVKFSAVSKPVLEHAAAALYCDLTTLDRLRDMRELGRTCGSYNGAL